MINQELTKLWKEREAYLDKCIGYEIKLRAHHTADFSEFVVDTGGDVSTYRVYGNKQDGFTIGCK